MLVKISPTTIKGFDYAQLKNGSADIAFVSLDGGTEYPFEIDTWDTSGTSLVWVKLPELTAATQFKFLWGDESVTASAANAHAVWTAPTGDSNVSYAGVWHMGGATGSDEADSATSMEGVDMTAYARVSDNGNVNDMLSVAGKIGAARQTDKKVQSKGCHFLVDNYPQHEVGNVFTVSLWYYYISGSWHPIVATMACEGARGGSGWMFRGLSGRYYFYNGGGSVQSLVNPGTAQWAHCVAVFDGANKSFKMYVNGQLTGSNTSWANAPSAAADHPLSFGHFTDLDGQWSGDGMYGYLDEIRVMKNGAASGDWVKAEYDTVATAGFLAYSDAKQLGANELTITAEPEEIGTVTPGYGLHTDMTVGVAYPCTSQDADIVYDETHHGSFTGWTLYEMNDAGEWVSKGSDDTRAYDHYQEQGMSYKLVWQISDIYRVAVAATSHGGVDVATGFHRAGSEVTLTATPETGAKFAGWTGVPAGTEDENPLTLTVDGPKSVVANFVTDDGRLDIDLTGGDQTVVVGPGKTYTVENVIGNPAAKLTVTGGGSLVLPDQDLSAAFAELIVKDTMLTISSESQLGAGAVTVENGGFVVTANITQSKNVITVTPGATATFAVAEGVQFVAAPAKLVSANATVVKDGVGFMRLNGEFSPANGVYRVDEGELQLYGTLSTSSLVDVYEKGVFTITRNVFDMTVGAIRLHGGRAEQISPINGVGTNMLAPTSAHMNLILNGDITVCPSADGSHSYFQAMIGRTGGTRTITVEEGAVLDMDADLLCGSDNTSSFVKKGAGTLRLLKAPHSKGSFDVQEGTLAFAKPGVRLDKDMVLSVAEGAKIELEDGASLDTVGSAVSSLLDEAGVWLDASRCKTVNGGNASVVANYGSAGGTFAGTSPAKVPVAARGAINGLTALSVVGNYSHGCGLGCAAWENTSNYLTTYVVARLTSACTFAGATTGKDQGPVFFAPLNGSPSSAGGFRYKWTSATKMDIYFNGNGTPLSLEDAALDPGEGAFIDCAVRRPEGGSFRRFFGDDKTDFTAELDGQTYGACNIGVAGVGCQSKSGGSMWTSTAFPAEIAEVLAFSRELTAEEDEAIRGYLAKKWLGSTKEWPALPETAAEKSVAVSVPEGAVAGLELERAAGASHVAVVKSGAGTLSDHSSLQGAARVEVRGGKLAFGGTKRLSAAAIWLDADDAASIELDENGKVASLANKGWAGGALAAYEDNAEARPGFRQLNGRNALDFDGVDDVLRMTGYTSSTPRELHAYVVRVVDTAGAVFSLSQTTSTGDDTADPGSFICNGRANAPSFGVGRNNTLSPDKNGVSLGTVAIDYMDLGKYAFICGQVAAESDIENLPTQYSYHAYTPLDEDRAAANDLFQIGARNKAAVPTDFFQGCIAELIVLEQPLVASQIEELVAYLRLKWMGVGEGTPVSPRWLSGEQAACDRSALAVELKDGSAVEQSAPTTVALASFSTEGTVGIERNAVWNKDVAPLFDVSDSLVFDSSTELTLLPFPHGGRMLFTYGETCTGFDSKAWSFAAGARPATVAHDAEAKQVDLVGSGLRILVR